MKHPSIPVFILIMLLTACASQPIIPTVIPNTSIPIIILTSTFTPEPAATTTSTALPTETFALMRLSTDPNKSDPCNWGDITSGRFAWNVKQNLSFLADAVNAGWKGTEGGATSDLGLNQNSKDAVQLAAICKIDDSFMGFTDGRRSYVAAVGVKNIDNTFAEINFLLNNKNELNLFLEKMISKDGGNDIIISRAVDESQANDHLNDVYAPMYRLYNTDGEQDVITVINKLQSTGVVPDEMEKILLIP
jgi:hypothetical protein